MKRHTQQEEEQESTDQMEEEASQSFDVEGTVANGTAGAQLPENLELKIVAFGDDVIKGGDGNDFVIGQGGDDNVFGDDGNDQVFGGPGNDTIYAGQGRDESWGQDGDDNLWALAHRDVHGPNDTQGDTLHGGPGNDRFHTRDGEQDVIDCGPGVDTALIDFKDVIADATPQNPNGSCEVVNRHARRRGEDTVETTTPPEEG